MGGRNIVSINFNSLAGKQSIVKLSSQNALRVPRPNLPPLPILQPKLPSLPVSQPRLPLSQSNCVVSPKFGKNTIIPVTLPISSQKTSLESSVDFETVFEIVQYFKDSGIDLDIDVNIKDFSDKHVKTLNLIRKNLATLKKMGIDVPVKGICLSDWRNIEKTKQLLAKYGLISEAKNGNYIEFPSNMRAYCGASSNVIFINSSEEALIKSNGVFEKFLHEIGHRMHFTYYTPDGILKSNGANSVLGKNVQNNFEFGNRQLKVLGIEGQVFEQGNIPYNITSPMNGRFIPLKNFRVLNIDTTKMIKYMNDKCHCYNKTLLPEQVAEVFEDLLRGRQFDDLTMLMYDFAGGGRIPNLKIKGQKYDDYIKSLYENKELVNTLKEYISITLK